MRNVMRLTAVLALLVTPAAGAATVEPIPLPSAGSGLAVDADGNAWVALISRNALARVTPAGDVTETASLGGAPVGVGIVDGKVWAALPNAKQIAVVDPANPGAPPALHATNAARCGPVAIVDGGSQAFVSLPFTGDAGGCAPGTLGAIQPFTYAGAGGPPVQRGDNFDLVMTGGKLFAPDFSGDVIRRLGQDLATEATYPTPPGSGPFGVADASGSVVATLNIAGRIGRVAAGAPTGTPLELLDTPVLADPYGVLARGDSVFAAASGSGSLFRFPRGPEALPSGGEPWEIGGLPDGRLVITDRANARLLRYTSLAPKVTAGDAQAGATSASVPLTVDPGGEPTTATVEYGTTTAYGATATAGGAASGTQPVPATAELTDLQPGTTYHYRAVATNSEGTTRTEDRTFTTAFVPGPTPPPAAELLAARITFTAKARRRHTTITRIRVAGLVGGERIAVTCRGRGCRRTKPTRAKRAGSVTIRSLRKRKLRKGAKVTVRVTLAGRRGRIATAAIRPRKAPKVTRGCLAAGAPVRVPCA